MKRDVILCWHSFLSLIRELKWKKQKKNVGRKLGYLIETKSTFCDDDDDTAIIV